MDIGSLESPRTTARPIALHDEEQRRETEPERGIVVIEPFEAVADLRRKQQQGS
jgi:hypothetical protein